MAFVTIASSAITVGEPVTSALLTQIKDNEDDLNTRTTTLEGTTNIFPPVVFEIPAPGRIQDGAAHWRAPFALTLLGVRVFVVTAGSAGSVTIDVEKSAAGGGSFSTVLTGTISAAFGSGNYYVTSGTLAVTSISSGDIIRVNVDALQTGQGDVQVIIEYEKT